MPFLIAVTGKGGTGKTTVSSLLVRALLNKGIRPVLVVDADPNSTLAPLLGLAPGKTISDIREDMMQQKYETSDVPKQRLLETYLEECIQEAAGFDLLTMGRPEGKSCYCYVNNLLRHALAALRKNYKAAIVDNEAGMEHLSRMNTDNIDCLLVVSEPTPVSARSAARIVRLASELGVSVHRSALIWNKVTPAGVPEKASDVLANLTFDVTITIPLDDSIARLSAEEISALEAETAASLDGLLETCVSGLRAAAS